MEVNKEIRSGHLNASTKKKKKKINRIEIRKTNSSTQKTHTRISTKQSKTGHLITSLAKNKEQYHKNT